MHDRACDHPGGLCFGKLVNLDAEAQQTVGHRKQPSGDAMDW
jgi:hypothetical protein